MKKVDLSLLSFEARMTTDTGLLFLNEPDGIHCEGSLVYEEDVLGSAPVVVARISGAVFVPQMARYWNELEWTDSIDSGFAKFMPLFDLEGLSGEVYSTLGEDAVFGVGPYLLLTKLKVPEEYRGQGLGLLATLEAIKTFSSEAEIVAIHPFPLQFSEFADREPERLPEFLAAQEKLIAYYEGIDFHVMEGTRSDNGNNVLMLKSVNLQSPKADAFLDSLMEK